MNEEGLVERWTLFPDELALLSNKSGATRLGFAVLLRFFAVEGRFPREKAEAPDEAVRYVAEQVGVPNEEWPRYDMGGRAARYHRSEARRFFGFRECTASDAEGSGFASIHQIAAKRSSQKSRRSEYIEREGSLSSDRMGLSDRRREAPQAAYYYAYPLYNALDYEKGRNPGFKASARQLLSKSPY